MSNNTENHYGTDEVTLPADVFDAHGTAQAYVDHLEDHIAALETDLAAKEGHIRRMDAALLKAANDMDDIATDIDLLSDAEAREQLRDCSTAVRRFLKHGALTTPDTGEQSACPYPHFKSADQAELERLRRELDCEERRFNQQQDLLCEVSHQRDAAERQAQALRERVESRIELFRNWGTLIHPDDVVKRLTKVLTAEQPPSVGVDLAAPSGDRAVEVSVTTEAEQQEAGARLPVFPDIGCTDETQECAFIVAGIGMQCEKCRLYLHPGDKHHAEVKAYYDECNGTGKAQQEGE